MALATLALAAQGASAVVGGVAAYGQAKAQKEQAERNAYIGRTRAIQTSVSAGKGLNSELSTLRATLAANGQRMNVGTDAVVQDLKGERNRDRRIEFGNRMQEAADYRTQAANFGAQATSGLLGGLVRAGPSMFDLYQLHRKGALYG